MKQIIIWIIVGILAISTAVFGYLYIKDRQIAAIKSSGVIAKTSGGHNIVPGEWIKYTDSDSSLAIQYPSDWFIYMYPDMYSEFGSKSKENYYKVIYLQEHKADFCDGEGCAPGEHAISLKIAFRKKGASETLQTLHKIGNTVLGYDHEGHSVAEDTTIAGLPAVKYWDDCQDLGCGIYRWDFIKNNIIITITYNYAEDAVKKTFDQITDRLTFAE